MQLPNPALWHAFQDGHCFSTAAGDTVEMTACDAGALALPTGRIVASDPLLDPWSLPFSVRIAPGSYPVYYASAAGEVALVMVLFGEGVPVRWQRAKPRRLSVDSATGCLMDHKVARFLRREAEADRYDRYVRQFEEALTEEGVCGSVRLGRQSGANIVLFRTWGGDGAFPAFYGYNAQDELVCLTLDFFLENVVA